MKKDENSKRIGHVGLHGGNADVQFAPWICRGAETAATFSINPFEYFGVGWSLSTPKFSLLKNSPPFPPSLHGPYMTLVS